ncbi:MAG: hypothetical protein MZV70_39455 [Desulfobacterales bacterium]|nr:hypothetical protein [Desulfobacterales bacterium]
MPEMLARTRPGGVNPCCGGHAGGAPVSGKHCRCLNLRGWAQAVRPAAPPATRPGMPAHDRAGGCGARLLAVAERHRDGGRCGGEVAGEIGGLVGDVVDAPSAAGGTLGAQPEAEVADDHDVIHGVAVAGVAVRLAGDRRQQPHARARIEVVGGRRRHTDIHVPVVRRPAAPTARRSGADPARSRPGRRPTTTGSWSEAR